ncbi:MAG: HPr-rel-A system PqqD family peptide chaperone [Kordiimonadaceae bacterium]|nr:HPr-rel-A system PqqD family peptide chaperone [Kordiimonadaceae bacterium]MBO6570415.1 HPr-rel-A system PqqD family peptide chaperone [Kordiimonadaceae bacterium]MBO6965487.1 HPr-rel-A system PqqD family peptide chaperone [Kordiimonadaceae bacterium]
MPTAEQGVESAQAVIEWTADPESWMSEEFNDTHLVFFKPSAETHFLNFLSFGALELVGSSPATNVTLWHALLSKFALSEQDLPLSLVETVVQQLDEAGLISPVSLDAQNS